MGESPFRFLTELSPLYLLLIKNIMFKKNNNENNKYVIKNMIFLKTKDM